MFNVKFADRVNLLPPVKTYRWHPFGVLCGFYISIPLTELTIAALDNWHYLNFSNIWDIQGIFQLICGRLKDQSLNKVLLLPMSVDELCHGWRTLPFMAAERDCDEIISRYRDYSGTIGVHSWCHRWCGITFFS